VASCWPAQLGLLAHRCRCFSKVLFPSLRIGYLVVPHGLVDAFTAAQRFGAIHVPALEQAILADFIGAGLLLGYAAVPSHQIDHGVRRLKDALRSTSRWRQPSAAR
jgi:DNA-binding transcriptional MocR family regulator